jgi:hypothetical protein
MKYTRRELASKIRKDHPGSYDDLDDDTLVEKYLNKHPKEQSNLKADSNGSGLWRYIIWILAIYGGLALIDSKVTNIRFFDEFNSYVKSVFKDDKTGGDLTSSEEFKLSHDEDIFVEKGEELEIPYEEETSRTNKTLSQHKCSNCMGQGTTIGCEGIGFKRCKQGKVHCSSCNGRGSDSYSGQICLDCNGTGITICRACNGNYSSVENICFRCDGKGFTQLATLVCFSCDGDGKSRCTKLSRCKRGILTCTQPKSHNDKHCSYCRQDAGEPHGYLCDYGKSACNVCKGSGQIQEERRL